MLTTLLPAAAGLLSSLLKPASQAIAARNDQSRISKIAAVLTDSRIPQERIPDVMRAFEVSQENRKAARDFSLTKTGDKNVDVVRSLTRPTIAIALTGAYIVAATTAGTPHPGLETMLSYVLGFYFGDRATEAINRRRT